MSTPAAPVREIVERTLRNAGDDDPLGDDESLVASGRLSSLDVVEIVEALEAEFGFELGPDDFDALRFDTLASITALVAELRARA
jgi:acyl carrier protein